VEKMEDLPEALTRLTARLETLEQRVYALEHPSEAISSQPAPEPAPLHAEPVAETLPLAQTGVFVVLGRALLGIAGAYLLRAVAESGSLPRLAVASVAIVYALLWLVWASRTRAGEWFASATYACTSALIIAPMLWELTLRFKILPPAGAAGVLSAFVCAATALAWKRNLTSIYWVANAAAVVAALALSIATRDLAPFIAALLLMALVSEFAAGRNRELSIRPLTAAAADLAIWALIFIYSSPPSTRGDYPALRTALLIAPGFILFSIYGSSTAFRTVLKEQTITAFETVQTMIAFLLAASSLLYFAPRAGATVLGVLCLVLAAAGYAATYTRFDRASDRRNYRVFAAWSVALLIAGSWLCLPILSRSAFLGVAAVAATVLGARQRRLTLEFHGLACLLAAAAASNLLDYVLRALAGALPGAPAPGVCLVAACAVLCYAVGKPSQSEPWQRQLLHLATASVALGAVAALLVEGLMSLAALGVHPGAQHLAFIRTLTLCAAALALAYSGAHWRRMELTRLGYAALVLVAVKLVFEDLRHGHLAYIAASIFLVALTLIAVPRLTRRVQ
jgi:hypothetical protein